MADSEKLEGLLVHLDDAISELNSAEGLAKAAKFGLVLDTARLVILQEDGPQALEARAKHMEEAGIFAGSDWDTPQNLVPALTTLSLQSPQAHTVMIEAISEFRMLAVALGNYQHPAISAEHAHHFLTQAMASNMAMLFTPLSEAERVTQGELAEVPRTLVKYLAERIGYEHILDTLIEEIWRILRQRPIQTEHVKQMVTQIAVCQRAPDVDLGTSGQGAERLVSSLYGPTQACREDPGLEEYCNRIAILDAAGLRSEAQGFARAMHDTGLVSPYHAELLRFLLKENDYLLGDALGLSRTGNDCLMCYHDLIMALVDKGVFAATSQAIYGLSMMLERGILYQQGVAQSLWRQLNLRLSEWSKNRLLMRWGADVSAGTRLLEGVLCMLGMPLGVGQGNNPTCQSARALSIWANGDPTYLLQIITSAARDDEICMHFEGHPVSSREAITNPQEVYPFDLDPVSMLLVPHLDYIYKEMGRLCLNREGDPHRWINPEFHGWWVGRGFCINVDVRNGQLIDLEDFIRNFYAYYHPFYNGNQPLIHPQPAGIAVTDSSARFIGWHAITIERVTLDQNGNMRVYFYNPNNDSGQDWGNEMKVSTADNGERFGESSLLFEQFASRVYIFHYDSLDQGEPFNVPQDMLELVQGLVTESWGISRTANMPPQASPGSKDA